MSTTTFTELLKARAADDRPGLLFGDRVWSWAEYVGECRVRARWLDARAREREGVRRTGGRGPSTDARRVSRLSPGAEPLRSPARRPGAVEDRDPVDDPIDDRVDVAGHPAGAPVRPLHLGVLFDNVPEMVFLLGGAALSGHVIVALNTTRGPAELARDAAATDVDLVAYESRHADAAARVAGDLGVRAIEEAALEAEFRAAEAATGATVPGEGARGEGVRGQGVPGQDARGEDVRGQDVPGQDARGEGVPGGFGGTESGGGARGGVEPGDGARGRAEAGGGEMGGGATGGGATGPVASADDLVMLIFTSGTSGRPRAVRVTQRKIAVPGASLAAMLKPEDVVYCSMPLFHSGAIMAAYAPAVASGAALVLRRRFSASSLLPDIRRYGVTYLHYVGKALSYVLSTPARADDADNTLKIAFGNEGSAIATKRFGERFGCFVIDAFGSTETAISITPDPFGPPGCLGRLPAEVEIRDPVSGRRCATAVIEDGRLLNPGEAIGELVNTAGPGLFEGYYNDPGADDERIRDGAFWSGDMAYADEDGYVFFAGRGTERLRVDGENLAVAPIEAIIRECPGVVEAAVYPVPDAAAGDQVMAAVVLDESLPAAASSDVGRGFAEFLAGRKELGPKAIPRYIRICRELPQTPSHKVLKRVLVKEAWRTADPVWYRPPGTTGFRELTDGDRAAIAAEFGQYGRRHLLSQ